MAAKKKLGVSVELYAPFSRYRTDLLRIDSRCFGPNGSTDEELEEVAKEALFIAVIKDEDKAFGYCLMERLWPESPYMSIVAIEPEYRGKGALAKLVSAVEDELRIIGFTHFEINARVSNGYADKIARAYGSRIEVSYEHGSKLGMLRFMRIKLEKEAAVTVEMVAAAIPTSAG